MVKIEKIIIKVGDTEIVMTLEEAEQLKLELNGLFSTNYYPIYPKQEPIIWPEVPIVRYY